MPGHISLRHPVFLRYFTDVTLNPKPCNCFLRSIRPSCQVFKVGELGSTIQTIRELPKGEPTNASFHEGKVTLWESSGDTGRRGTMSSFAMTADSSRVARVTCSIPAKEDSSTVVHCRALQKSVVRIPGPMQGCAAVQWISRREYGRNPTFRVAGKKAGQDLLDKEDEVMFKRIVSEGDSVTMFYGSDVSSSSEDEAVEHVEDNEKDMTAESHTENNEEWEDMQAKEEEKVSAEAEVKPQKISDKDSHNENAGEREEIKRVVEEIQISAEAELKPRKTSDKINAKKKKEKKNVSKEEEKLKARTNEEGDVDRASDNDLERTEEQNTEEVSVTSGMIDNDSDSDNDEDLATYTEMEVKNDGLTKSFSRTSEQDNEELEMVVEDELEDLYQDDLWDEEEEGDVVAGDGGDGGGVVLGGTHWGKEALDLAEQVLTQSGSDLSLYAFKVSPDAVIRVRLDKFSDRYGSPTMTDIETFLKNFMTLLEVSGEAGIVPKDVHVEVSSPGAERVVRVPDGLERFKEFPMYVQYIEDDTETEAGKVEEKDSVLQLEFLNKDTGLSTWKLANVKVNRETAGKGRPLNSKQKKWRAEVPLKSIKQVRLYLDV